MPVPPLTCQDADYMHYGFWLKKTTDSDGVTTYDEVETFAGSSVGLLRVSSGVGSCRRHREAMKAARSACT